MSFYTIDSLTFTYNNNNNNLFENLNFLIEGNQHIGLIGPNGCGKTTLAKLMLGILRPTDGRILLEGTNIRNISLSYIGSKVGYVFQNPDKQLFCPTVWEQMSFSFNYGSQSSQKNIEDKINYYLEIFDLAKYKDASPLTLSRGEKQRLALASVLSRDVKFLILDEPTTGLDLLRKKQLEKCLLTLRNEGKGYMIISHEARFLDRYVDKLLTLGPKGVDVC
ncbi:MAG: energy-coupling factor ABC transporter ATP-binding protein [Lutispora sp.]|mgnify:CR=1 FL=1|uniref:energy-coupling factor ABC transporter ATP-binding protein n=1 Tax=Lutispora sp. TaxID=2828727 RepID=UPI00356AB06C